ncbi:MAG: hypothetical protein AAF449_12025 [Myxococcota bacterium]
MTMERGFIAGIAALITAVATLVTSIQTAQQNARAAEETDFAAREAYNVCLDQIGDLRERVAVLEAKQRASSTAESAGRDDKSAPKPFKPPNWHTIKARMRP